MITYDWRESAIEKITHDNVQGKHILDIIGSMRGLRVCGKNTVFC